MMKILSSAAEVDDKFFELLSSESFDIVVDIGSRDCGHAAMFRRFNGSADIYAFEGRWCINPPKLRCYAAHPA